MRKIDAESTPIRAWWNYIYDKSRPAREVLLCIALDSLVIVLTHFFLRISFLCIDSLGGISEFDRKYVEKMQVVLHMSSLAFLVIYVIGDIVRAIIKTYKEIKEYYLL